MQDDNNRASVITLVKGGSHGDYITNSVCSKIRLIPRVEIMMSSFILGAVLTPARDCWIFCRALAMSCRMALESLSWKDTAG